MLNITIKFLPINQILILFIITSFLMMYAVTLQTLKIHIRQPEDLSKAGFTIRKSYPSPPAPKGKTCDLKVFRKASLLPPKFPQIMHNLPGSKIWYLQANKVDQYCDLIHCVNNNVFQEAKSLVMTIEYFSVGEQMTLWYGPSMHYNNSGVHKGHFHWMFLPQSNLEGGSNWTIASVNINTDFFSHRYSPKHAEPCELLPYFGLKMVVHAKARKKVWERFTAIRSLSLEITVPNEVNISNFLIEQSSSPSPDNGNSTETIPDYWTTTPDTKLDGETTTDNSTENYDYEETHPADEKDKNKNQSKKKGQS